VLLSARCPRERPVTAPVLDLDGHLVGRRAELARLANALEVAGRRGGEFVLLSGVPGVGKSTLLQGFGDGAVRAGGVFAYGRYQEGARAPYSALGEALGVLVGVMEATALGERDRWRADLHRGMAQLAGALGGLVPGLDAVLGPSPAVAELDAAEARHRLQRAAVRLVSITASYRPVVLAVDDLQWADRDSILLLSELLTASVRNLVLVGAHRAGEFAPSAMGLPSGHAAVIELDPLSSDDVEALLADVCGRDAELGEVAVTFHDRTGGNPLQVRQLLGRAQREGAARAETSGHTTWDLRALASIEATTENAGYVGGAIDLLPTSDGAVLSALACIGREFDLADAVAAAARPAETVGQGLWTALDRRLVEAVDARGRRADPVIDRSARYRFSHDRVAEVARARLVDDDRRAVHLRFGRWLVGRGDERLFEAARHLGIGGRGLLDGFERARFAEVERRAAVTARRQASFPLALECYRAGLALLGPQRWAQHPALARELQLGAAEAAYLVSDTALLEALIDEAEVVLDDPADRARLSFLRVKGQVAQNRLQEALETGRRALDALGVHLPHRASKPQAAGALLRMKLTMRRWSDERLLGLPRCQDRRTIEAQRILSELRNIAYIVRPDLFPAVVGKKLELTVTRGLVPSSPVALASFGVLLVVTGDYVGSQRFAELGMQLAERPEFREARPETQFLHLDFIRPWRYPMREALRHLQEAFEEALASGDPESAGWIAAVLLYQSFMTGLPLAEIDALAQSLIPEIRSHRAASSICRANQQLVLNLMGRSDDPFLLAGESGYDERDVLPVARRENDVVTLSVAAIHKLTLHFWCGDEAGGLPFADVTARYLAGLSGTPNVQLYHLINALSRVRVAPRDRATARAVNQSLALHRKWAVAAPANFAAPYELIEGVWAHARGDLSRAERHLDRAAALAEEHQLSQISGLAHEEASAVVAETGRLSLSRLMLRTAHQRYLSLGMAVRSDKLEREHPWLLRDLVRSDSAAVDPVGVHRLVQALPAAATLQGLAEILLGAVADVTGAGRVLLFIGEGDRPEAHAVRAAGITAMVDGADIGHDVGLVREAIHAGRIATATTISVSGMGPTTHSAALAVPVGLRGRVIGVVYAEYAGPAGALRREQEEALVALCAHAAAPLWNFELEGRLREAEEHRRSLVDMQSRFIPTELLRILDVDDIRRVRRGHRVERRVTVLISDIRGYTALLEDMNVSEASDVALGFLRAVEVPIVTSNGLLQDVRGDEVLAVFDTRPDDAVRAGLAMLRSLREHNRERTARGSDELRVGIGINTGQVALGLVGGVNRMALTVIGDAVNLASRVENTTKRYGTPLLITDETYAQLAAPELFAIRRMERVTVVNRRRPVTIYEVYDEDPEPLRAAKCAAQPAFDEAFARFDAGDVPAARSALERCRALLPDDAVAPLHLAHCDALDRGEGGPSQEVVLPEK
jgi:predicted ATPase/class 3 adenylate cyclase